ncbi:tape measure protein [Segatella copri]|uniref:tape measure protein n=1 Tax=Segatella copri TaxID=165179 RepID=UPI002FEEE73F
MAELRFDVKANFEEVTKLRSECEKLRAELLKTNKSTDPAIVADLTEKYADASNRLKDLTQAASRAAYVMSSEFNKKMQAAAREVYSYELQMQATKDRIEKIQQQITNKRLTLGVTTDKSSIDSLQKNIDYLKGSLAGQTAQLKNLEGGAVGARQTLENMRNEYVLYAGSANPAKEATNMLTDSMSQMIERMKSAPTAGEGMTSLFQRVTGDAHMLSATLLGGLGFEQLAGSIFNTRSQFQQLEISFNTMLGSADKSKQLMDELIQTAAHTPFDMSSITGGAKQLLAYGTEAKDVNKTLVQLGDIASGLNIPLGDLVYLYGTTVSQGRMFTMDLRQFMGRGVPLAEELGKILHQNTTEVQESVSKGKVTSDIFKEAIANMTQAGGRFGGLMEQQSKTLEGQWSNIGDSIQQAFNEIGKKSEGVFSSGLSIISAMVENWQEVIKVIGVATIAVGSYRASLMAAASIRKAEEAQQADDMMKGIDAEIKRLQDLENSNYKSLGKDKKQERVSKQQDLASIVGDTAVSDDFVKARLDAAEQEGVISAQMRSQLETKRELLQAQQQATAQSQIELDEEKRKTEELRQQKIESLKDDLKTTTEKISNLDDRDVELARQYTSALNDLQDAQDAFAEAQKLVEETAGGANLAFDAEGNAVNALEAKERLETATKQVNVAQTKISTIESERKTIAQTKENLSKQQSTIQNNINTISQTSNTTAKKAGILATTTATIKNALYAAGTKYTTTVVNLFSSAVRSSEKALKSMWAAMAANPIGALITLGTTLYSVFSMFGDETEEISADTTHFGETTSLTSKKVETLMNVLRNTNESTDAHKKAKDELIGVYEQYGIKCDNEKDNLETLKNKHDAFIASLQLENAEREKANALMSISSQYEEARKNLDKDFSDSLGGSWLDFGQHIDKEDISAVQMMFNSLFSDDALTKIDSLRQKMDSAKKGTLEYANAAQEYDAALRNLLVPFEEWGKKMGYNSFVMASLRSSILKHIDSINSLNESYKKAEDAIYKGSTATVDWNNSQAKARWIVNKNKQSIQELVEQTDNLINLWNKEYGLNLKIHYDDSEIPNWMKSMTTKELRNLISRREADILQQENHEKKTGHKLVTRSGGKFRSRTENQTDVAMAKSIIQSRTPKSSTTTKSNTTHTIPKKTGTTDDPQARAYERKKAEEDYSKSISSYSEKAIQDMTKNRINAMNEGYSKELAQITENADKERKAVEEGIDKLVEARKKRDQAVWVNSGKGRKANLWKQSKTNEEYKNEVLNETMKDSKGNPVKVNGMNMTIGMSVANQMNAIRDKAVKQNEDVLAKEAQSMYDYLKTYGTFQEQKLAIAADYAKRISEVENSTDSDSSKQWKIKSLKEEQKKETDSVEASAIMQKIDWYQVFGNVGGIMKDALVPLLADLDKFVGTDKFQNLGADQQKSIVDAMQNIRNSIGNTSDLGWKDLARDVVAYQDALKNAKIAQEEYTKTETLLIPRIKVLQEQIESAKKSGNVAEQTRLQEELNKVQGQLAESGKKIVTANTKVRTSGQKLAQTTQNVTQPISAIHEFLSTSGLSDLASLWDSFDQLKGGIDGLKALDEAKNAADGLKDMGKEAGDAAAKAGKEAGDALGEGLSKAGLIGQIVAAILKILDVLKDGIGTLISSLIDTVLNAVNGILKNILSGDFITQIGGSLVSGIGNILNTISFGGFNSLFGVGGNAKEVNRTIDKLTARNEILTDAIDRLRDSIDKTSGIKAVEDSEKAEKLQKEKEQNLKDIMVAQMGYHGSHGSFNRYFRGFSQEQINKVSEAIGRQWNGNLSDIRSADEANALLQNPDIVNKIQNTGKGNYGGRVLEKLKDYAAEAGTLEDIADDLAESLTQISFDSLKSEFIDTLMDMNSSAQDFSDNFSKMLMQAVLKAKVDDLLGNDMQAFYDEWTERAKANGGKLSQTDINELKGRYDEMVQEGLKIRDEVAEITGYKQSYEQSASSGSFESMSQDTGEELNGRFTAVQIATEGTYEEAKLINTKLDAIAARDGGAEGSLLTASVNTIMGNVGNIWLAVDEGRTILAQSLMYLQSIDERQERWHKPMLQAFNDIHELKDKMSRL